MLAASKSKEQVNDAKAILRGKREKDDGKRISNDTINLTPLFYPYSGKQGYCPPDKGI